VTSFPVTPLGVVGSRVHLNPLVVTFSPTIRGVLWDPPGLLPAIPRTAALL